MSNYVCLTRLYKNPISASLVPTPKPFGEGERLNKKMNRQAFAMPA